MPDEQIPGGRLRPVFHGERKPCVGLDGVGLQTTAALRQHDAKIILGRAEILGGRGAVKGGRSRLVGGGAPAILQHEREIIAGAGIALFASRAIPFLGGRLVLGDPATEFVGERKIVLGLRHAAVGRLPKPKGGLEEVGLHAEPVGIHVAHIELGRREPEFGGAEIALERGAEVRRQAPAEFAHHAEIEQRRSMTLGGGEFVEADGFG